MRNKNKNALVVAGVLKDELGEFDDTLFAKTNADISPPDNSSSYVEFSRSLVASRQSNLCLGTSM